MKCQKCGAELTEGTKFCSYCGTKIKEDLNFVQTEPAKNTDYMESATEPVDITTQGNMDRQQQNAYMPVSSSKSGWKSKLFCVWRNLDSKNRWMKYLVLAIAIGLIIFNIMGYSWGKNNSDLYSASDETKTDGTTEAANAITPYGATECIGKKYSTIKNDFSTAGFTSVKIEKIEDLASADQDKVDTIESVSINGKNAFTKEQEFDADADVLIRYHVYKKCAVTVHIEFVKNLMLSKYDVNFLINDVEKGTLTHGEDKDFELSLDPGEYSLTFKSTESSSVKGETTLTIDCNTEAAYKISCSSDKVSVEELYVDRLTELNEGEIKLDTSASDYKYKNYQEVESALKVLGFSNIKYNILYDINWGVTDEGEVDSVSIAGNTDFKRGDVFTSDSEIVITYHMKEEDDPTKAAELLNTVESDKEPVNELANGSNQEYSQSEHNLTVDNCQELKDLLTDASISSIGDFVGKYKGKIIEFDGRIDYCVNHGNYNTRFDYLVSAGDYDPDHQIGPTFKFENVNYNDLNTDLNMVSVGLNVHIVAEVDSYNSDTGLIFLKPVKVMGR